MRFERRLTAPRWLPFALPFGSLVAAFVLGAVVLGATGRNPLAAYERIIDRAFLSDGALSDTLVTATPLLFCGLAAAIAFRMGLFNIGGEGQFFMGAIGAAGVGLALGDLTPVVVWAAMLVGGAAAGALWGAIPGVLRAYASTNEIITSLMMNYVAALVMTYLIFDSQSFWRDTETATARVFPQGARLDQSGTWPHFDLAGVRVPLGFWIGVGVAAVLWVLWTRTRAGFAMQVIGDAPRAARYAGMRTRATVVGVMALSGGIAGAGGASQIGDFRHLLDPKGLEQVGYGYAGIVVAALARYNPFAVVVVSVALGGLTNAGYSLQGAEFPSGLVGVLQGLILFCALASELLVRYRVRFGGSQPVESLA